MHKALELKNFCQKCLTGVMIREKVDTGIMKYLRTFEYWSKNTSLSQNVYTLPIKLWFKLAVLNLFQNFLAGIFMISSQIGKVQVLQKYIERQYSRQH